MKNLLPFLKGKKLQTVFAPVLKLIEACFELTVPIFVAQIIDNGIPNNDSYFIITRCLIILGLGGAGLMFSVLSQYMSAYVSTGFASSVRNAILEKINGLSFGVLDKIGSAAVLTRITGDVERIQTGVNMGLRLLLRAPFIVFGATVAAFLVDAITATVFAVAVPVLFVIVFVILIFGIKLNQSSQKQLEKITLRTEENVSGVRVIRAFAKEDSETSGFEKENNDYTVLQTKAGKLSSLLNPLTYSVINISIIFILYFGGIRVNAGLLSGGKVVALYNYMSQILVELIKFANLVITVTKATASAKRVSSFLGIDDEQVFPLSPVPEKQTDIAIRFRNVSLSYNGGANAVENVSFELKKGETLGIIGGTGSGKSSLVNLIPRFYDATDGTVFVNETDVKQYPKEQLREKIAICMQKPFLMQGTILDNITLWNCDQERLNSAISASQSEDIINSKQNGVNEEVKRNGNNFSGGQKQRLSVARSLYKKAEILILDDSSSALDSVTEKKLFSSIRKMGKTVIIVSQKPNCLLHADKILVLDNGKPVAIGTHSELLNDCSVYRNAYKLQNEGGIL